MKPISSTNKAYSDTGVDCVLDIQVWKKGDIWNTEAAKEMFICLPKSRKGV